MSIRNTKRIIGAFLLLLACISVSGSGVSAQLPRPSLMIEGDFLGKMKLDDPPVAELKDLTSQVSAVNLGASLTVPVIFGQGNTMIFLEGKYHQRAISYHKWPANVSKEVDQLHEVNLGVTLRQALGHDWAVTVNLTPQIASNFEGDELEDNNFKVQGTLIIERAASERWTLGLGAAYSSTFGEPIPIPLLTYRYESGGKWYGTGTLPSEMNIYCRLSSLLHLGLMARADGGMYHIPETFPAEMSIDDPELQYVSAVVGPAAKIYFEGMEFAVRGGLAYQSYGLCDGTDEVANYKYDFELGPTVSGSLNIPF